ncbi:hypothetical protein EW146_g7665, partial [Bondarzewia mesenterica]
MDVLSVIVPGSRHPTTVTSKVALNFNPVTANTSASSSASTFSSHTSRRKPKITYRSPSSQYPGDFYLERTSHPAASSPRSLHTISTNSIQSEPSSVTAIVAPPSHLPPSTIPPLPLYHPLGPLALSLPEIDPETFGLRSTLPITIDDSTRRSSSRARRPAAKLRDADMSADPTVQPPAA